MELTYTKVGDYYIPDIKAPDAPKHPIGKYGRMRKNYLKEHRPVLYESLILNGTLWNHLSEIEKSCNERMEHLTSEMMKNEGVTESPQNSRSNGMGTSDEQYPTQSRRNRPA